MKKLFALLLSALLVVSLSSCGKSAMQKSTGTNATQAREIENILESTGVDWETIEEEPFELTDDEELNLMETNYRKDYTPYNLIDKSGKAFYLVIQNKDKAVVSIVDIDAGNGFIQSKTSSSDIKNQGYALHILDFLFTL